MNDTGIMARSECAGGCGELMAFGVGFCERCARLAEHYDAQELKARFDRIHAQQVARLAVARESAHLGAVERAFTPTRERAGDPDSPRRGLFRFLGWKVVPPALVAAAANQERVDAESASADGAADRERRRELLAKLPRMQCGVRRMSRLPRLELWNSDVPLGTVAVVLGWDVLRWAGCAAMESVAWLCRRRDLRGRLAVTGMLLGTALGLAVSWAAWGLR